MARARDDEPDGPSDDMPVFAADGLPYIDEAWLLERIRVDKGRRGMWKLDAHRFRLRVDRKGRAVRDAYLTHAMMADLRLERWHRHLVLTQAAVTGVQKDTRLGFGYLVRERRMAACLTLKDLSRLAGLDDKTIKNIETARCFVSRRSIQALLDVPVLGLSWNDVGQELLEANPADGRKHKRPRQKTPAKKED